MQTKVLKKIKGYAIGVIVPILVYGIVALICRLAGANSFFTATLTKNIIYNICYSTLLAMGIMLPLLSGRMDYTSGVTPTLSAIIAMHFVWSRFGTVSIVFVLLFAILFSLIITLFSYGLNILMRIPMMISSLGLVMIYEALCNAFGGVRFVTYFPVTSDYFKEIKVISQMPYNIIILAVALVILWGLLYHTKYGKDVFSLAANPRLAINSGVNQAKNLMITATIAGIIYGIAGVWYVLSPTVADQFVAPSGMSSVFVTFGALGGVLIGRYLGKFSNNLVWGILCGTMTMTVITQALPCFSGLPTTMSMIVNGAIIVLFSAYQSNEAAVRNFFVRCGHAISGLFKKQKA
jgi:ribose/xylose/arabinose/galactoside ABC-type transport system permease subunit